MLSMTVRMAHSVLAFFMAICIWGVAAQAAVGDDKKPQTTHRPGVMVRPGLQIMPRRTLEVQEFSGDFARWTNRMTINQRRRLLFRWKNIRSDDARPRWQVSSSANAPVTVRGGHLAEGRVPHAPAMGSYTTFNIDFARILPALPPAAPRKYYVRIVVSEPSRPNYVDSRPVVITYQQPSQEITQFTEEGLSTTPQNKVAPPGDRRYSYPKIYGVHMDWCKRFGKECGQPAADEFCRREGYRRAKDFSRTSSTTMGVCEGGKCKTRIISNNAICHNPTCRAFFHITCTHDRNCETKSTVAGTIRRYCSWENSLVILSKKGNIDVPFVPNQTNTVNSIPVSPQFVWLCGGVPSSVSCLPGTNEVDVSRWYVKYKGQKNVEFRCRIVYQVCTD